MKRSKAVVLAIAMIATALVPQPAPAGQWCETAVRFEGACESCNFMCLVEWLFASLGGWSD